MLFGAGYATAQDRLFLMDALRHTAEGRSAELLGAARGQGRPTQLGDQDFSPAELDRAVRRPARRLGPEGAQGKQDILDYVDGINAYIERRRQRPDQAARRVPGARRLAAAVDARRHRRAGDLLVGQFTVQRRRRAPAGRGARRVQAALRQEAGATVYDDFRRAEDPEAPVVAKRPFNSDRPGPVPGGQRRCPTAARSSRATRSSPARAPTRPRGACAALPAWARTLATNGLACISRRPTRVLVTGAHSVSGHPLARMGPQVGYYSPEILVEQELHGPGIDVSGMTFPGGSPYPLIGHGIDFAWTGTTANGDTRDTFAEELCNPDGSPATPQSTHTSTRASASRSRRATSSSRRRSRRPPGAAADDHAAHDAQRARPGQPLRDRERQADRADQRQGAQLPQPARACCPSSAWPRTASTTPRRSRAPCATSPARRTGSTSTTSTSRGSTRACSRATPRAPTSTCRSAAPAPTTGAATCRRRVNPRATDPEEGLRASWNNKEARGWRSAPPARSPSARCSARSCSSARCGSRSSAASSTSRTWPGSRCRRRRPTCAARRSFSWMRRASIGKRARRRHAPSLLALLNDWRKRGSHRLDADGDGNYDDSPAVALMDAWWPRLVRGIFQPALGPGVVEAVSKSTSSTRGPTSTSSSTAGGATCRRTCARSSSARCAASSRGATAAAARWRAVAPCSSPTLRDAAADVRSRLGQDPAGWKVATLCPTDATPLACDEIVPITAGAVATPAIPFHNRGTFHQAVEVQGRRPTG